MTDPDRQLPRRITGEGIDPTRSLKFFFDGKAYIGHKGDTLASALIANGVRLVGRSFKYHRPRGIVAAGSDEPNALMTLGRGARATPNLQATTIELYDGLEAKSQNRWPTLGFDLMALNDLAAPFLTAGFYYKTFMWPPSLWEKLYEPLIRRAAGLGQLSGKADPDIYDKGFLHTDLLIIGGGMAGLNAALEAGRAGVEVILAESDFCWGGQALAGHDDDGGASPRESVKKIIEELEALPNIRLMLRTSIFGAFDHGIYAGLESCTDNRSYPDYPSKAQRDQPRQTLWRIYTKQMILASGAYERSIAFGNNDRPGIMLASAAQIYAKRFGALVGKKIAVMTNNDSAWASIPVLAAAGAEVSLIDTRDVDIPANIRGAASRILTGCSVIRVSGRGQLRAITLDTGERLKVECLAVSGGWNPAVNLVCHGRERPRWDAGQACFIPDPDSLPAHVTVIGAANGVFLHEDVVRSGRRAGLKIAARLGKDVKNFSERAGPTGYKPLAIEPVWRLGNPRLRAWVDLQNDVTTKDITLAHQEGFSSVEHVKRYTTLGMATDQGKSSNVIGLAILAEARGQSIEETGTTIFRPPVTPVAIGAFAGRHKGANFRPVRHTPSHRFAADHGASFTEAGQWLRAQWFTRKGETHWRQSVDREVLNTRQNVGICDVTTLGKIDIQGCDAAIFLDHIYANMFSSLKTGRCRYGVMLREDGFVKDDGTTARLAQHHYLMTTTTANAVAIYRDLEFARQCLWPDLDVQIISVTEQWAQYAIAGPHARKLLEKIIDAPNDISNDAFPYMACGEITICNGIRARLFRLSFSGELAYELAVPARFGDSLMRVLVTAGKEFDIAPYGTEALGVMRIEKGHAAGNELNGQTTAAQLGLGRMVSDKKDCIGKILSKRPGLMPQNDSRLVGLKPVDPDAALIAGAHLFKSGAPLNVAHDEGYVTSVAYSPILKSRIGLGYLADGDKRVGEAVIAHDLLGGAAVEAMVCSPHFYDPTGERLRS